LWVRQGRTDAWIAHKLDISVEALEQFKRDHRLTGDPEPVTEAPMDFFPTRTEEPETDLDDLEDEGPPELAEAEEQEEADAEEPEADEVEAEERDQEAAGARRRRRGRRGGRRRRPRSVSSFEGTFDHGDEGYGLWLDPAVQDDPVYAEHWAGHRPVEITIEEDQIVIRRAGGGEGEEND
jgi:hypothetical protein